MTSLEREDQSKETPRSSFDGVEESMRGLLHFSRGVVSRLQGPGPAGVGGKLQGDEACKDN